MTPKPPLKVAIVGYTPHRALAPWGDPEWEIWGLNDLYLQNLPPHPPKRTRWFELHPWEEKAPDGTLCPFSVDRAHVPVLRTLIQQGGRVYIQEPRAELPEATAYPYAAIYERFKDHLGGRLKYFTNTISFEIALAILEGASEIGIFGVDMMTGGGGVVNNEYGYQRPSCEYWIAAAEFSGIPVHLPDQSDLMKSAFVYGEYSGNIFRKKLEFELANSRRAIEAANVQAAKLEAERNQYIGRASAFEQLAQTWMPGDNGSLEARAPMPNAHVVKPPVPGGVIQAPGSDGDQQPVNRVAEALRG